jgi:phosphoribulokinase
MATSPFGLQNKGTAGRRPILLGMVGDSAAGKTTLTAGIENIFGKHRVNSICTDDYHRYDREGRKVVQLTPLNPACNYMEIMEQHLQLLAMGEPILKPVYNHHHGTLDAPEIFEPSDYVVIEGLLGFYTKPMRDCFDVKIFLDPPEDLRRAWKIKRDTSKRNYTADDVIADMQRREPDSKEFIEVQREYADIVVRFIPPGGNLDADPTKYNVNLVLRPTLPHPYLAEIAAQTRTSRYEPIRFHLARDRGKPVDVLEIDGSVPPDVAAAAEEIIWEKMAHPDGELNRDAIGVFVDANQTKRSESLALTQLLIVFQLVGAAATR